MNTIPETGPSRQSEGSLKLKSNRPRSRTSSGGILRLDINKFANDDQKQINPPSPQPSVDRLSVTFATEEKSVSSDSSVKVNLYDPTTPPIACMEKVRFPTITDGEDSDEDYSASVTAIMQRRASTRKSRRKGRRTSSPFSYEQDSFPGTTRRRSSCYTTSSGDTAISMEDSLPQEVTQEQIFENIRLHKEVLSNVKMQPWGMRRKVKLVQQAKSYIKRHQGVLQERLAQSRSTRDILARWNIYLVQKWHHYRREMANLSNWLIPWESRIKEIESHFGSVVASYFTFLRWLFWVNLVIAVVLVAFVAIPELLTADPKSAGERKMILPEEKSKSTNLLTLWDFEGVLKYSPLFYGYYTNRDGTKTGYRLPFAYFMTGLGVYVYSFVATLRKMAENSRMSKLSEKDDECVFTWKLFTGWDYTIGNAETAHNRVASIILGFKEALLEEAEKKREPRNWKNFSLRVLVNFLVLLLLGASAGAVVLVVQRSTDPEAKRSWWRRNEITVVMSSLSIVFPILFELLGLLEHYHPRKQLRLQLARIMVLNLLNLYSLIFALFGKIGDMTIELQRIKNESGITVTTEESYMELWSTEMTAPYTKENEQCYEIYVDCANSTPYPELKSANLISTILSNLSLAILITNYSRIALQMNGLNLTNLHENSTSFKNPPLYENHNQNISNKILKFNNSMLNLNNSMLNFTEDFFENFIDNTSSIDYEDLDISNISIVTDSYDRYEKNDTDNETNKNLTFLLLVNNTDENYFENLTNETFGYTSDVFDDLLKYLETNVTIDSEENNININISNPEYENSENITENLLLNNTDFVTENILHTLLYEISNSTVYNNETNINNITDFLTTWYESNMENISTTLTSLYNFTTDSKIDTDVTQITEELNITLTQILQNITNETRLCRIKNCVPSEEINSNVAKTDAKPTRKTYKAYDIETKKKLRSLCWETMFGQELVKLTIMDLVLTIISTLMMDFFRAIFVRVMNNCWCWDLEKQFPQYGDFKIAENILHLVNNQGQVWMGMFFSPGLAVINLIKLAIMMYLRSWAVLTCNVPHEVVFRASRSNNFYLALLLTMLFLCVLPVGYAIVWEEPSWHCGPFSNYKHIYHIFTQSLQRVLPKKLHRAMDYIASPGIVIPLLVLLVLIIYYMISLTNALREANTDLKLQLRRERTEERRKMFQIADRRRRNGSGDSGDYENTPFGKWKKLLPMLPTSKSFDADASNKDVEGNEEKSNAKKNSDFLVKFIKKAMKKPTVTPKNENQAPDDATDTELHESLPHDVTNKNSETNANHKLEKVIHNTKHKSKAEKETDGVTDPNTTLKMSTDKRKSKQKQQKRDKYKTKDRSTSKSSSSKDLRQDSVTSTWSENIPVIKISGTGSSECILEQQPESFSPDTNLNRKIRKMTHQTRIDIDLKSDEVICENQVAAPECPASGNETLVTGAKGEYKEEKIDKKDTTSRNDQDRIKPNKFRLTDVKSEEISLDPNQSIDLQKSINSGSTYLSTQSKTESSTAYKE